MFVIDFETKSCRSIEAGIRCYATDCSTDVLVLGWLDTEDPNLTVHQWFPGNPLPDFDDQVYAFNASFEAEIWEHVMVPKYGAKPIPLSQWEDIKALCARYGLPQNLAAAASALDVPVKKQENGKALIKMFCVPPFDRPSGPNWQQFMSYNRDDVLAAYYVLQALPSYKLIDSERRIFDLNWEINRRGVPVDKATAAQVYSVVTEYVDEHNQLLPQLTGGQVEKISQTVRIRKWLNSRGINVDNVRAETIQELLATLDRDDHSMDDVITVLELRAVTGLSSVKKYKRILEMEHDGHIYYNSNYYGAHTGRITGSGFQLLNLPRAKVKDPEETIAKFFDFSICEENPVLAGRALVRSVIKAPDGRVLIVADYSSIEYILLVWLAEDWEAVERFAEGFDQYKDLATHLYHTQYEDIDKNQRQTGKIGILGCGYGLGKVGMINYASKYGVDMSLADAGNLVDGYRKKYNKVVQMWYKLQNAAIAAVSKPGTTFLAYKTRFLKTKDRNGRWWLMMTLPSGRAMFYFSPRIIQGKFGSQVATLGLNQETKQWTLREMTPGKWTENIIQALGRDLLYYGKFKIQESGKYDIIASIYDEVISLVDEDKADLKEYEGLMASLPDWAKEGKLALPVRAEGYISKRYKKE